MLVSVTDSKGLSKSELFVLTKGLAMLDSRFRPLQNTQLHASSLPRILKITGAQPRSFPVMIRVKLDASFQSVKGHVKGGKHGGKHKGKVTMHKGLGFQPERGEQS